MSIFHKLAVALFAATLLCATILLCATTATAQTNWNQNFGSGGFQNRAGNGAAYSPPSYPQSSYQPYQGPSPQIGSGGYGGAGQSSPYPTTSSPAATQPAYRVAENVGPTATAPNVQEASVPFSTPPQLEAPQLEAPQLEAKDEMVIDDCWCFEPGYWYGPLWSGSLELGLNAAKGNAQSVSIVLGADLKRKTGTHTLSLKADHARTSNRGIDSQHNALGEVRLDRHFGDTRWSLYTLGTLEYDEFKDFDLRLAASMGLGYSVIKNDVTTLTGRFGSGVSREIGGVDESYVPEANFGIDFERELNFRQKLVIKVDHYPDWGNWGSYRIVTDAGWEILLDEEANLSLKIGAIDRYDSTPNGRKANDLNYSFVLLFKI
jgi:hypothetical protein